MTYPSGQPPRTGSPDRRKCGGISAWPSHPHRHSPKPLPFPKCCVAYGSLISGNCPEAFPSPDVQRCRTLLNQPASLGFAISSHCLNLGKFFLILFISDSTIQQGLSMQIPLAIQFYNVVSVGTDFATNSSNKEHSQSREALVRSARMGRKGGGFESGRSQSPKYRKSGREGNISSLLSPRGKRFGTPVHSGPVPK